jgi:hypothetical protein
LAASGELAVLQPATAMNNRSVARRRPNENRPEANDIYARFLGQHRNRPTPTSYT